MIYCKKCVQTDSRPGIRFDDEQICSACRAAEAREEVDWNNRFNELMGIAEEAKSIAGKGNYDCVIGVSGGKDSHFQSLYARDVLGLTPLLANSVPDNITDVGRANLENLVTQGFSVVSIRPNPITMKEMVREGFFKYGNPAKATEYTLFSSAWIVAYRFGIPLVIQGENPAHTLGIVDDMESGGDALTIFQHDTIREDIDLWDSTGVNKADLSLYRVPGMGVDFFDVVKNSIWLEHYAKEWSFNGNTAFAVANGLRGREWHSPAETGKLSAHCSIDSNLHIQNQFIKYLKFGFGFVTDEVGYAIREGLMTRDEGIDLVKRYDGRCHQSFLLRLCDYMDISYEKFWEVLDGFVNTDLFEKSSIFKRGGWKPLFTVGEDYNV